MSKARAGQISEDYVRKLEDENLKLKAAANEEEDRLRRMSTKMQKQEAEVKDLQKKVAGQTGGKALPPKYVGHPEIERLEVTVREREKANEVLKRQIMVLKHSPAATASQAKSRRPLSAQKSAHQNKADKGEQQELSLAVLSSASEDEQRIVLALQGELERARSRLSMAQADLAAASNAAAAQQKRDEARWDIEPLESIRRGCKEMQARLTLLENSHEQVLVKYNVEHEQHDSLVAELNSLSDQLAESKAQTHQLQRSKQLEELRRTDGGGDGDKEIIDLQKELDAMEKENESLRRQAFSAGSVKVQVRVKEQQQKEMEQEIEMMRQKVEVMTESNEKNVREIEKVDKTDTGSISNLDEAISKLTEQGKRLERESEALRERLADFVGSEHGDGAMQALELSRRSNRTFATREEGVVDSRGRDFKKMISKLRMDNANEVRETIKLKQLVHLHECIELERGQMEGDVVMQTDRMRKLHSRKVAGFQARLSQIENRNDQLRRELMLERTSAPAASDDASATMDPASSSAVSASRRFSPSDGAQNTCTVLVENLILEKGIPAFEATGDPVTLLVVDFFLHDTQTSRPLIGFAPSGRLKLDMEVTVDQLFMQYIHSDSLRVQLLLVKGTEFETLASASLPLRGMLDGSEMGSAHLHAVELRSGGDNSPVVGKVNVSVTMLRSIAQQAHSFMSQWAPVGRAVSVVGAAGAVGQAPSDNMELFEPFTRKVGFSYNLTIQVVSVSGVLGSARKRSCYAMHQFLDFDPAETDTLAVSDSSRFTFMAGKASYTVPCLSAWDKKLLSRRLDIVVFDDTPPHLPGVGVGGIDDDGLIGTTSFLLAPLLTHRGFRLTTALKGGPSVGTGGKGQGEVTVAVMWDPEPLDDPVVGGDHAGGRGSRGGSAGGAAMVQTFVRMLRSIKEWIERLDRGSGQDAQRSVFREWEKDAPDSVDGLDEATWLASLHRESSRLGGITDSEIVALFQHLTRDKAASGGQRVLKIHEFVAAVEGAAAEEHGEEEEIVERGELGDDGEEEELIPVGHH